tara:strand:+ start:854 stop:2038 length:1185 start_codon:yes stop_codon:yes gene_type:complete
LSDISRKVLVVILTQQLTKHTFKQFNCDLRHKNWKILFLNVLPIVNKKLFNESLNIHSLKKRKNFIYLKNFNHLFKEINKIQKPFGYINLVDNLKISFIDNLLKKKGGKKIYLESDQFIPVETNFFSGFKFYFKINKIFLIRKLFVLFYSYLRKIIFKFLSPSCDLFFIGNFAKYKIFKKKLGSKRVFNIDNYDFEKYNLSKKRLKKKYIVYIDQDFGEDFDYKLNNFFPKKINLADFWNKTELFFRNIEKNYPQYKVKIAAHHRRKKFNFPLKRKFIFNKTLDLIRDAKLVVGSSSSAFAYAILAKKPILLLSHESFKYYSYRKVIDIKFLKEKLGLKIFNLSSVYNSKLLNKNDLFKYDNKKYKDYTDNIIANPQMILKGNMWKKILVVLNK